MFNFNFNCNVIVDACTGAVRCWCKVHHRDHGHDVRLLQNISVPFPPPKNRARLRAHRRASALVIQLIMKMMSWDRNVCNAILLLGAVAVLLPNAEALAWRSVPAHGVPPAARYYHSLHEINVTVSGTVMHGFCVVCIAFRFQAT